jgi:cob(I)alamin adenosyltransferase
MPGYVHVYTGEGKGKTTAALGLALRAAGAGLKVFIAQFAKGAECSEHRSIERFDDLITLRQYGRAGFILNGPDEADLAAARRGLREIRAAVASGAYGVVVLDEVNVALHLGLLDVEDLLHLIDFRPAHVELILTGRYADPRIVERADLVTDMREVKHYYRRGIPARVGIEK